MMNSKEFETIKKNSLMSQEFSSNTKTSIVTNDLQKLTLTIRKSIATRKSVTVLVIDTNK